MAYDIIDIPSENRDSRGRTPIELIIIHSVGLDLDSTVRGFAHKNGCHGGLGVSPHYLIPQITGQEFLDHLADKFNLTALLNYPNQIPVIRFVQENERAWHAGVSAWKRFNELPGCERGLNSCSIGIEFHAPDYGLEGKDWFYFTPFTMAQMTTGAELMRDICSRHNINPYNIIGHSDIAPWNPTYIKTDPGPLFPWKWLYDEHQLGLWPTDRSTRTELKSDNQQNYVKQLLKAIGYKLSDAFEWTELDRYIVNAFRMHFMQDSYQVINPAHEEFGKIDIRLIDYLERFSKDF